jgi:hypothetical protein
MLILYGEAHVELMIALGQVEHETVIAQTKIVNQAASITDGGAKLINQRGLEGRKARSNSVLGGPPTQQSAREIQVSSNVRLHCWISFIARSKKYKIMTRVMANGIHLMIKVTEYLLEQVLL